VEYKEDPEMGFLTNVITNVISEDPEVQELCHRLACRQIKVPTDVVVGGNVSDLTENLKRLGRYTIIESDPRHDAYWGAFAVVQQTAIARCLGGLYHPMIPAIEADRVKRSMTHKDGHQYINSTGAPVFPTETPSEEEES
jgi:hypothetical protein